MQFMVSWKVAPSHHQAAGEKFLKSGAPTPEGVTIIGRWHAPGSVRGWALMESDNLQAIYEHAATWASVLETEIVPVFEDADAGQALAKAYGS